MQYQPFLVFSLRDTCEPFFYLLFHGALVQLDIEFLVVRMNVSSRERLQVWPTSHVTMKMWSNGFSRTVTGTCDVNSSRSVSSGSNVTSSSRIVLRAGRDVGFQ